LVELGFAGGRTGCRDLGSARAVAEAAAAVDGVTVAGVAGSEGMLAEPDDLLRFIVAAGESIEDLAPAPLILSAGGSMHFDAVTQVFGPAARDHGWRIILRSGSYVTHDHCLYASSGPSADLGLRPALEVWAQVLSTPEPGLALLGAGKRDVPIDEGMPVPLGVRAADGAYRPLVGAVVDRTNDQHAYLRGADVTPGELVKLGISHPCTAFDKWRVIPMADDDDTIVELVETYF
jgi:D-serine deaminase-like pyridoxal phosphate-dependent protein